MRKRSRVRVWWPPTDDKERSGFRYFPFSPCGYVLQGTFRQVKGAEEFMLPVHVESCIKPLGFFPQWSVALLWTQQYDFRPLKSCWLLCTQLQFWARRPVYVYVDRLRGISQSSLYSVNSLSGRGLMPYSSKSWVLYLQWHVLACPDSEGEWVFSSCELWQWGGDVGARWRPSAHLSTSYAREGKEASSTGGVCRSTQ